MVLALVALVLAQSNHVSSGIFVTATTEAMTLYVDPAGSDANSCSSSFFACKSIGGALQKVPRFVRHSVTINVASGTYDSQAITAGLNIQNGVTLSISGTLDAVTPATGTGSGTTTASSAGSTAGPATITDSGQSWTIDNLKGKFIQFASGTLSGSTYPIISNTSTTVSFPVATAAGTGAAYSIVDPGAVFTGTTANSFAGFSGQGTLTLSALKFTVTSGTGLNFPTSSVEGPVTLTNLSITGSGFGLAISAGLVAVNRCFAKTTGTSNAITTVASSSSFPAGVNVNSCFVQGTTTNGIAVNVLPYGSSNVIGTAIEVTTGTGLRIGSVSTSQSPGLWITCTTTGSGTGIQIGNTLTTSAAPTFATATFNGNVRVTGCGTGVLATTMMSYASFNGITLDTVTTGFSTTLGAVLDFRGGTPTFTSVTNELSQDGTAYTFASLVAAGPPAILTNTYGSRLIR